jgi:hypothetical protein
MNDHKKPPVYPLLTELAGWTLQRTGNLPKSHRFTFGQRLDNMTLDALLLGVRAIYSPSAGKRPLLAELNLQLELLRVLWRLVHDQHWISQQQLIFVIGKIDEIGRMTGGWMRQLGAASSKHANAEHPETDGACLSDTLTRHGPRRVFPRLLQGVGGPVRWPLGSGPAGDKPTGHHAHPLRHLRAGAKTNPLHPDAGRG